MDFNKAKFNTQVAEEEDDGFYAEIRKQIVLLLTAYDDEVEQHPETGFPNSMTAAKRVMEDRKTDHCPQLERNLSWCPNGHDFEGPVWHVNSWENGNGTGVFIPPAVKYKRYCIFRRMRKHDRKEKHRQKDSKIQDYPCF